MDSKLINNKLKTTRVKDSFLEIKRCFTSCINDFKTNKLSQKELNCSCKLKRKLYLKISLNL